MCFFVDVPLSSLSLYRQWTIHLALRLSARFLAEGTSLADRFRSSKFPPFRPHPARPVPYAPGMAGANITAPPPIDGEARLAVEGGGGGFLALSRARRASASRSSSPPSASTSRSGGGGGRARGEPSMAAAQDRRGEPTAGATERRAGEDAARAGERRGEAVDVEVATEEYATALLGVRGAVVCTQHSC